MSTKPFNFDADGEDDDVDLADDDFFADETEPQADQPAEEPAAPAAQNPAATSATPTTPPAAAVAQTTPDRQADDAGTSPTIRVFDNDDGAAREAFTGVRDDRLIAPSAASVVRGRQIPDKPASYTPVAGRGEPQGLPQKSSPEETPEPVVAPSRPVVPVDQSVPDTAGDDVDGEDQTAPRWRDDPVVAQGPEEQPEPADRDEEWAPVQPPATAYEPEERWEDEYRQQEDPSYLLPPQQDPDPEPEPAPVRKKRGKRQSAATPAESTPAAGPDDGKGPGKKSGKKSGSPWVKIVAGVVAVGVVYFGVAKFAGDKFSSTGEDTTTVAGTTASNRESDAATDTTGGSDRSGSAAASPTASPQQRFEEAVADQCRESTGGKKVTTSKNGDHSSPMKAVAGWEYAYYVSHSAQQARGYLTGTALEMNAVDALQSGIDSAGVDAHCVSMHTVGGSDSTIEGTVTEFTDDGSGKPRESSFTHRFTTEEVDGKWSIAGIESVS
jgi:hypothetical protein